MSEQNEAVPLLSAEDAEVILDSNVCVHFHLHKLQAIASGAAVVIPAAERVDVERVRSVIAEMLEYARLSSKIDKWADELTAAIGDKT